MLTYKRLDKLKEQLTNRIESSEEYNDLHNFEEDLITSLEGNNSNLYNIYQDISTYSFESTLLGLGNILLGRSNSLSKSIDGWKLLKYEILLREIDLYQDAVDANSWEIFKNEKNISVTDDVRFIEKAWALCAHYYFDIKIDWPIEPIKLMETAVLRGDIDFGLSNNHEFPILIPLLNFLYSNDERTNLLDSLSSYEPFGFLKSSWEDDDKLKEGLESLCLWHTEQCHFAMTKGSLYPTGHYALFPVWIYALDKCRERELGVSALPDNPLMEYGKKVRTATIEEENSLIIQKLDNYYVTKFDDNNVDFYEFWKEFTH